MVTATVENITKGLAEKYLETNTANYRKLSPSKVDQYAREMEQDLWETNYEPIHFNEDGVLVNGQHRLEAIRISGKAQVMLVVRGIKRDVVVFDIGKARTIGDISKAQGLELRSAVAGAVGILMNGFNASSHYGKNELIHYYLTHDYALFDRAYLISGRGAQSVIMKKSGCMAAIYCALKLKVINEEDAETFAIICNSGIPKEGVTSYAPLQLRKTLQNGFRNENGTILSPGAQGRQPTFECTWQAIVGFVKGNKPQRIYKPDGNGMKVVEKVRNLND